MTDANYWQGKRVLVTGADGFVGGNLARALLRHGAHVWTIERDVRPMNTLKALGIYDKVTIIRGDILDPQLMNRVFAECRTEYCYHLAAQAIVGVANQSPISTFESNIRGTWTVLEAARLSGEVKGIVVASSDKAYGVHDELPYVESTPLSGTFPYDASKACADMIARCYAATFGMPVAVARNANTYGPGDLNFSRLVPDAVRCAVLGRTFEIRSDGKMKRDFLFVQDSVEAYLRLGESLAREQVRGQAFNFGSGKPASVLDVCTLIMRLANGPAKTPKILNLARHEIPEQYLSTEKARRLLGWQPRYGLAEGLKPTIAWYRNFLSQQSAQSHL